MTVSEFIVFKINMFRVKNDTPEFYLRNCLVVVDSGLNKDVNNLSRFRSW